MKFLTKIRDRQFAKKWGGAYNLSRAVLAGVLAAGCLMPGFAEAASLKTNIDTGLIEKSGNTATITRNISASDYDRYIYWEPGAGEKCTINVNYVNSTNSLTITPEIDIRVGYVNDDNTESNYAKSNTVDISNVTFENIANIYGGYVLNTVTAIENLVTIKDTKFNKSSDIYGGRSLGSGDVTGNAVTISGNTTFLSNSSKVWIFGGQSSSNLYANVEGAVTNNTVTINGTIEFSGKTLIVGGQSSNSYANAEGAVTNNTVTINGTIEFSGETRIFGGVSDKGEVKGNTVTFNSDTVDGITTFTNNNSFIYGGASDKGQAINNTVEINGNTTFNSDSQIYGGWGTAGANGNSVIISGGTITGKVYGGQAVNEVNNNSVIISGGTINGPVFGGWGWGYADVEGNSVIISGGTITGDVYGGLAATGGKDNRIVLLGNNATYKFTDTQGAEQTLPGSDNINIKGIVYGSNIINQSGNEIHVYGSNINVGNIANFDKLHFFIDDQMHFGETMLTINGITNNIVTTYSNVSIPNEKLAVTVSGKPQASGDKNTITLVHNESGEITDFDDATSVPVEIGELLSCEGTVALTEDNKDLVLTLNVEKSTVNENGKSLVETRAAAAFVVNNMSDFMLGTGMEQAKAAAGGVTPIDAGTMAPFAAVGGSNMRYTTGSYVDVNGWNGAVGFAKQADKLLFGVAVEHGRGNYDSYLDNGVHASGDIKSTGGVIFGEYKLDNGVHYDAALRAGRVKSDYNSTATSYDESSTYYGFSLGGGKELTVSDKATLDVYGRYYFSHTNGSDVSLANNEAIIDFDAVNSHRLRIGGRYTTTLTEKSKAYAGLAWQYEFGGDAKAAINGYSAPTPSMQGHSAIVEAGYKLNAGKNLALDFNLNGAMGKQRGIGGGIGAQWLF